jgi:hypothetical protein
MNGPQLFRLGKSVMTAGVAEFARSNPAVAKGLIQALNSHRTGDWGNLDDEDKKANDEAVRIGNRILSSYEIVGKKVWIITEWDRSVTTFLFPDEY